MKELFASNLKLKLLAVIFSLALWFFVAGQSRTEVGFIVPISYKGIPKDLIMTGAPPDEVEVRVTGPKLFINNLSPSQISAELDMSGAKEGINTLRIQPTDIITPMGVDVQRLRPSSVDFRLERITRVELPVRALVSGRPAPGYRVVGRAGLSQDGHRDGDEERDKGIEGSADQAHRRHRARFVRVPHGPGRRLRARAQEPERREGGSQNSRKEGEIIPCRSPKGSSALTA